MQPNQLSSKSQLPFLDHSCPSCGLPMWLAQVEPTEAGYDVYTFECLACDLTEIKKVGRAKKTEPST